MDGRGNLSQCIMTLRMAGGMCQRCIIGPDGWSDYFVNVHDCMRHWYSTFGIEIVMIYCIKVIHYISNMEGLLFYFESWLSIMYNPSTYSYRFLPTLIVLLFPLVRSPSYGRQAERRSCFGTRSVRSASLFSISLR